MTESTGLTVFQRSDFLAIAEGSELALAMSENMVEGDGFSENDLIRVKTPSGGSTRWVIEGPAGEEIVPEIEGVLVYNCNHGNIWRSDDPKKGEKPILQSTDLKFGRLNVPIEEVPPEMLEAIIPHEVQPGVYDWPNLPYCQWGTGKGGFGKYAKEGRLLFVLRRGDAWPLIVHCGPGSLGEIKRFIIRDLKLPQYRTIIRLTLAKTTSKGGVDYSKVIPTLIGSVDAETGVILEERYTDKLRASHEAGRIQDEGADE